jgi:transposase
MTLGQLRRRLRPIQAIVTKTLRLAAARGDSKGQGTARDVLRLEEALWTFSKVAGVEPTNNLAEQAIRPAVIWRKTSFGTDSTDGSRFAERMMTVCATLAQQGRNLFSFTASKNIVTFRRNHDPMVHARATLSRSRPGATAGRVR